MSELEAPEPAQPFNLDAVLRALQWTILSPSFAGMTVAFAYMFQVQRAFHFQGRVDENASLQTLRSMYSLYGVLQCPL